MVTVEFFHDAVCGWCYLLSPRLRDIARRYQIKVVHRSFVLQRNDEEMINRFGSLEQAKSEILEHWKHCQLYAEDPNRLNIDGMRKANFHYPNGLNAALAAKTAEILGGQIAHWDYFDAVQILHLKRNKNIANKEVLLDVASSIGFDRTQFQKQMTNPETRIAVDKDNVRANDFGVKSIPSLLINEQRLISQTLTMEQLEALFNQLQIQSIAKEKSNVLV